MTAKAVHLHVQSGDETWTVGTGHPQTRHWNPVAYCGIEADAFDEAAKLNGLDPEGFNPTAVVLFIRDPDTSEVYTTLVGPFPIVPMARAYARNYVRVARQQYGSYLSLLIALVPYDASNQHVDPFVPVDCEELAHQITQEQPVGLRYFPDLYTRLQVRIGDSRAADLWKQAAQIVDNWTALQAEADAQAQQAAAAGTRIERLMNAIQIVRADNSLAALPVFSKLTELLDALGDVVSHTTPPF